MLNDLAEILKLESLMGEPEKGAPFGRALKDTLEWFLDKANGYGLKTKNVDGYCGYAEYGDGKEMFGILCHLDTVPAGTGWSVPAYKLTNLDGFLYGRGVVDDKGPAIIILHVLKALKEQNFKLNRRVRLITGLNEENGSECLKYYAKNEEPPVFSITPAADFPVINSEKGILRLDVTMPVSAEFSDSVINLKFGDRPNVVPFLAECSLKLSCPAAKNLTDNASLKTALCGEGIDGKDISVTAVEPDLTITAHGVSGHAMAPEKADNAAHKLFCVLNRAFNGKDAALDAVYNYICSPLAKEKSGIDYADEKSGNLTMNLGTGEYLKNEKKLKLTLDLRLPLCAEKEDIVKKLKNKLPPLSDVKITHYSKNLYYDKNGNFISKLAGIYQKATGDFLPPVQTGGGTYARELPFAAAFGPTFPDTETNIHNADERISVTQFYKLYDIYHTAVLELDKFKL
jgi:succinyl-diaminopimelate desuccinylase